MTELDEKVELDKLPPLTLLLVVLSFLLVLAGIIGFVLPEYTRIKMAKDERSTKMLLLEEQKSLFPLFARADALDRIAFDPKLPFPERGPLARDQIFNLSAIFQKIASDRNMTLAQNSLDVNSLKNNSNSISMDVQFTGSLFDYRETLIALSELPFFSTIEKINIVTDPTNIKTFSTKILITIDKK